MGILAEKTKGNLSEAEERILQAVLYEMRMAFLELTNMISMQSMQPPPAPPPKDAPGPFAFTSRDRLQDVLARAGFAAVAIEPHDAPLVLSSAPAGSLGPRYA